jgi:hypothetical protein
MSANAIQNPGPAPRFDAAHMSRVLQSQGHFDAAEAMFFVRELEQLLVEQFNVLYAERKGKQFVPIDNQVDPGAESVTYTQFDFLGKAKAISDFADDIPLVNTKGAAYTQKMQSYGSAFGYSVQELRAAAKAGRSIDRLRADAARLVLEQRLDEILATGDSANGLSGLLNLSNVDTYTIGAKAAGPTVWDTATADEILADLNGMVRQVRVNTKEVHSPTRILMPTSQYNIIANRARTNLSDTTILGFFKGNNPDIEVKSWERLVDGGGTATPVVIAYDPKPMLVRGLMAIEFEMFPPQIQSMAYKISCHMRTGGVISAYPRSIITLAGT